MKLVILSLDHVIAQAIVLFTWHNWRTFHDASINDILQRTQHVNFVFFVFFTLPMEVLFEWAAYMYCSSHCSGTVFPVGVPFMSGGDIIQTTCAFGSTIYLIYDHNTIVNSYVTSDDNMWYFV